MQVLRLLLQLLRTTAQQFQGWAKEWIFLCLNVELGQRNQSAWSGCMFSLTATTRNRIMCHTNLCNTTKCHPWVILPMCYREYTYHGLGFQAVKSHTLQQLNFNHLFDFIFVQSCLQGEANEITCNTLEIELSVSSHLKKRKKDLSSPAVNSSTTLPTVLLCS